MGVLSEIGRFIGNVFALFACVIAALLAAAIWAVGAVVDLLTDVLSWINGKLEELLTDGATEVNTVQGSALAEFIKQNQATGKYTEISLSDLNATRKSVINVAVDNYGNIIDDQMIRSQNGISSRTQQQFNGQPVLKIKIPA